MANVPANLVSGLSELGHEAELYQPFTGGAGVSLPGKFGLMGSRLLEAFRLGAKVRRDEYDLIHIHYAYFGTLGILGRFPYILHCHGTDVRANLYSPVFSKITAMSLRRARRVYFSTPDLAEHVIRVRPEAHFLPNPVDTEAFSSNDPPAVSHKGLKVLIISRLEPIKGVAEVFSAVKMLQGEGLEEPLEFSCFDWGEDAAKYRKECGHLVRFQPRVAYERMPEILAQHDIVVGQLKLGILSMAELEAMAAGKPVIGHFAYPDWYGEPPPLIPAKNAREVTARISEAAKARPSLEEKGAAGRRWVKEYHDQRVVAASLASDYSRLLGTAK